MMSIECVEHWFATRRAYDDKNSASHGTYFPSTPITAPPSFLLSEKDMMGWSEDV